MKKKRAILFPFGDEMRLRIRKMKLTLLLVFLVIATFGNSFSQVTLSLHFNKANIQEVLGSIEKKTDYIFLYKDYILNGSPAITVDFQDAKFEEVLKTICEQSNIDYEVRDRQIILKEKANILMSPNQQQPQKKELTGTVKDTKGLPLPGASVVIKGTTIGIITDTDGNFRLSAPLDTKIIVISFIGMKTQEIQIGSKTNFNVTLEEQTVGLEEVVAVGYGSVKRKDLTGSVSSVSGSTLKDIPVTSVAQAMQGRMAGVQVTKTEGSPDAEIIIRVRGGGSLTQDNSPLYIVDGFPVNSISYIAPTDIASIDILKDASSTAIYGARGANGVVIITTKGGFEGKGRVSYNSYYGVKKITKTLDVLNPYEYVLWTRENMGAATTNSFGDFKDIDLYKQMKGTNWQDEIFGRTGTSMSHNIAISGGSRTSKYNISLTRNDEKEILLGSGYNRTNVTANISQKVNDWLTVDLNTLWSNNNLTGSVVSSGNASTGRVSSAIQFRPVDGLMSFVDSDITNPNNYEATSIYIRNPVELIKDDYRRAKSTIFNINGAATIKFSKNLNYRFSYGAQSGENTINIFYGPYTYQAIIDGAPQASITKTDDMSTRLSNTLTYTKMGFLPGHNLTAMAGQELVSFKYRSTINSARMFPQLIDASSAIDMMQLGSAQPITISVAPDNNISSFFGRLNYDYKGKYLISATVRADGSSKFAPGKHWGYFPSAGIGWRISDEKFMTSTKSWLTNLKMRASYGASGNNRISDNAWQKTFSIGTYPLCMGDGAPTPYLLASNILSNDKLKWETTVTRNIGVDFDSFKQRLRGSVEIYKNTTKDLLVRATIPSSTGYSYQWQNIGQTSNRGIEMMLEGVILEKHDIKLSASFNIAFNKNRIDNLGATKRWEEASGWGSSSGALNDYLIEEGGQTGLMYGYVTEGMYSFDDFNYANGAYTLKQGVASDKGIISATRFGPGSLKLKDQNGDFVVNEADRVVIGNANPKHTGGFNLTAQYKGLDFSAFFNWVYGNDIYNANKLFWTSKFQGFEYRNLLNIMNSDHRFSWVDKGTGNVVTDPTALTEMNKNATMWSPDFNLVKLHSWAIEDGSFLRLNTVTIGYSLPKDLLSKVKIEKFRVYVTAYNLWTWTNYSGYDPEVSTIRNTPLTPGVDWNSYPRSRTINVGLNVEF